MKPLKEFLSEKARKDIDDIYSPFDNIEDWCDRSSPETMPGKLTQWMQQYAMEVLEEYTQFLLKNGYTDTDVYAAPLTAID